MMINLTDWFCIGYRIVTCPIVGRLPVGAVVIVHLAAGLLGSAVGIEVGVSQWPIVTPKSSSVVSTINGSVFIAF